LVDRELNDVDARKAVIMERKRAHVARVTRRANLVDFRRGKGSVYFGGDVVVMGRHCGKLLAKAGLFVSGVREAADRDGRCVNVPLLLV
jgi:hypothetical protein